MVKSGKVIVFFMLGLAAIGLIGQSLRTSDPAAELSAARRAQFTHPEQAYARCLQILQTSPESREALKLAGEIAEQRNQPVAAIGHYEALSRTSSQDVDALRAVLRLGLKLGRLTSAERAAQQLTAVQPGNMDFQRQYADLLLSMCRRRESLKPLMTLVRNRSFLLDELVMLGATEELLEDRQLLNRARSIESERSAALTALGRLEAYSNKYPEAVELLRQAVDVGDDNSRHAIPALGRALLSANRIAEMRRWAEQEAPQALDNPDTRFVLAWLRVRSGEVREAVDHLNAALQADPNHRAACQLMGSVLAESGDEEDARLFLARAVLLDETERLLRRLLFKHREAALMRRAAELMEQLGRPTEAWAWWVALQSFHPQDSAGAVQNAARLADRADTAEVQVERDVVRRLQYRGEVSETRRITDGTQRSQPQDADFGPIAFEDLAGQLGLTTSYYGGYEGEPRGLWLYQVSGGGVAVTDADGDSLPDLYFVHGSKWPTDQSDDRSRNQLYRHRGSVYEDVSRRTDSDDAGLGQSAAVGDYDHDGFEDLYLANIGANRLLHNNGDGTYSDATPDSVKDLSHWTTSCLLADLNGDGSDDLFDVNYLAGQRPFEHVCVSGADRLVRACGPDIFQGEADQCLISDGAGGFLNVTDAAGVHDTGGPGLGIVAADFDESGTVDLFVANDMTANGYYLNLGTGADGIPQFSEEAILRGCALNGSGRAEACMGIAAGDVTEDGALDLFVTNFFEETNTLYSLTANGYFEDRTAASGIAEESLQMLSFGTQFLDADLDSHLDVVLVNGHVDDYTHLDIPWKMLPAAYRNQGAGRFLKLAPSALGTYGGVPRVGRAMSRLDWNSDGRDDLVITHLDGPPALLSNSTGAVGSYVSLSLSGTQSGRGGIGSVIRIAFDAGDNGALTERVIHVSAGDGYFCSNQRKVTIGLGTSQTVRRISIRWISGVEQQFHDILAGASYRIVEGCSRLFQMPDSARPTENERVIR